ncbi:hypothetical protein [Paenibacillus macerans]|uniref:Immunity protein 30 domain-containing protein n=1 Tax=Paenibacillus macerans TaxID=44252 RepID=A0A090ZJX1_PAEMA|nr:hypothetical protein [Paenibacillus macerans]KFN10555.1 hypothetical protein DJ90_843 [Paenibacillus macerans]MCY7556877.1 hypothetical protein [Paenibacillus macerans]MEC0150072.1 hypothetical protein [Paenibacillus macerans]SUD26259.1 Uncharacterised protein [Paenibacillus macerans]
MNIEELEAILSGKDNEEKIEILSHLCDIFESYNTAIDNFEDIILTLLNFGIKEDNLELKEEIFNTLLTAATYKNIDGINFDFLADNLENLPDECLHSALTTLSFTFKKKYLSYLTKYLNHKNGSIRADAINAINEIEGYWAKRQGK